MGGMKIPLSEEGQQYYNEVIQGAVRAALDTLPPHLQAGENATVAFIAGITLAASGLVLAFPAQDADELKKQLIPFMRTRKPEIEATLIDVAINTWRMAHPDAP